MPIDWDELLDNLSRLTGMYVLKPRFLIAAALVDGFSRGRDDGVMPGFRSWMSRRYPAAGGHPNPVIWEWLLAEDLFQKAPHELDQDENQEAVVRMCELLREYRGTL